MNIKQCVILTDADVIEIMDTKHNLNLEDLSDYLDINGLYECAIFLTPLIIEELEEWRINDNLNKTLLYTLSQYVFDKIGKDKYVKLDHIVIEFY